VGALLLVAGAPRPAPAQVAAPLPVGARVRLELADSLRQAPFARRAQWIVGTVVGEREGVLQLQVGPADTLRVARASVRRAAVSRGASRLASAVEQGVTAAFLGLAISALDTRTGARRGRDLGIGAALGAGIGVAIGVASPYERWRTLRR
jgi:hypothetical protein